VNGKVRLPVTGKVELACQHWPRDGRFEYSGLNLPAVDVRDSRHGDVNGQDLLGNL
jgi:hypothetical protein